MGYYFECPHCQQVIPLEDPTKNLHLEDQCEECGLDMCRLCCIGGLCSDCWNEKWELFDGAKVSGLTNRGK